MSGVVALAYKLLVNDRAKFAGLLTGVTFAVFLMIEMTSMFAGILSKASATISNVGASTRSRCAPLPQPSRLGEGGRRAAAGSELLCLARSSRRSRPAEWGDLASGASICARGCGGSAARVKGHCRDSQGVWLLLNSGR